MNSKVTANAELKSNKLEKKIYTNVKMPIQNKHVWKSNAIKKNKKQKNTNTNHLVCIIVS